MDHTILGFNETAIWLAAGTVLFAYARWLWSNRSERPPARRALQAGDRIGVIVDVDDRAMFTVIGNTLRANRAIPLQVDWTLQAQLTQMLNGKIASAGWIPVRVDRDSLGDIQATDVLAKTYGGWVVRDKALMARLRDDLGLQALVIASKTTVVVVQEGNEYSSWTGYAEASGLAYRPAWFRESAHAVLACRWQVIAIDPSIDLEHRRHQSVVIDGTIHAMPDLETRTAPDQLSATELDSLRDTLLALMDRSTSKVFDCLRRRTGWTGLILDSA